MILLFTDFGADGPYLAQMRSVIATLAPSVPVWNLLSNAPAADPRRSAYLLAALAPYFPRGSVFLAVVDPGVGGNRLPVVLEADGRWFVGPDNGLLNAVAGRAQTVDWRIIEWRPEHMSVSFHGRDLFAPIAGHIANGNLQWAQRGWMGPDLSQYPLDLGEVIYFDHYGNAITGIRFRDTDAGRELMLGSVRIASARTFCEVETGAPFWYCNSMGLVEVAINCGRADRELGVGLGTTVAFL